jgi:hypothetical protein
VERLGNRSSSVEVGCLQPCWLLLLLCMTLLQVCYIQGPCGTAQQLQILVIVGCLQPCLLLLLLCMTLLQVCHL